MKGTVAQMFAMHGNWCVDLLANMSLLRSYTVFGSRYFYKDAAPTELGGTTSTRTKNPSYTSERFS
jgi:hypothetical protein